MRCSPKHCAKFVKREVEPQAAEHDRAERFNLPLFRRAGELGLLGVTLPEEYGGAGMERGSCVGSRRGARDLGSGLRPLGTFPDDGAEPRRERERAPTVEPAAPCRDGGHRGRPLHTEPGVGTDVLALRTRARREGDEYVLDGTKTFITNGGTDEQTLGDAFIVYAALEPGRISSFLVEKGVPGFRLGQKWKNKLGMRASFTAELIFDGVRLPIASRLGEEGEGTRHMMRNLEIERLTLAGMSVGIAQRCLEVMVAYASERESFGVCARTGRSSATSRRASRNTAPREPGSRRGAPLDRPSLEPARRRCREALRGAGRQGGADRGVQVLGGDGDMGEYVVERLLRDAKLLEIGGGTLEAHQKNLTKDLSRDPGASAAEPQRGSPQRSSPQCGSRSKRIPSSPSTTSPS